MIRRDSVVGYNKVDAGWARFAVGMDDGLGMRDTLDSLMWDA